MGARYARRIDSNQKEIIAALRNAGAYVVHINGIFDILAIFRNSIYAIEIKTSEKSRLTGSQQKIKKMFGEPGPIRFAHNVTEALTIIGAI